MAAKRPHLEEGVVLNGIEEVVAEAERKNGPWPQLGQINFSSVPPDHPSFAERVSLWTMAGLLGAVTIYAIATGDREVLIAVLTIAAGTLIRLTRLRLENHKPGERNNDPTAKRRPKKRTSPE